MNTQSWDDPARNSERLTHGEREGDRHAQDVARVPLFPFNVATELLHPRNPVANVETNGPHGCVVPQPTPVDRCKYSK